MCFLSHGHFINVASFTADSVTQHRPKTCENNQSFLNLMVLNAASVENEEDDLHLFLPFGQKLIFTLMLGKNWTILDANVLKLFVFFLIRQLSKY